MTLWYKLHYLKCHQSYTPHYCQPWTRNLVAYYSLAFFLWYSIPVTIREKRCEFSISWAILACKLVYLLDVTVKKDQKTWLETCDFACFWGACYSARLSHLGHSYGAWHFSYRLASKAFVHDGGFISRQSSIFGAQKIVFLRILTLSKNRDFSHKKRKGDICNWT